MSLINFFYYNITILYWWLFRASEGKSLDWSIKYSNSIPNTDSHVQKLFCMDDLSKGQQSSICCWGVIFFCNVILKVSIILNWVATLSHDRMNRVTIVFDVGVFFNRKTVILPALHKFYYVDLPLIRNIEIRLNLMFQCLDYLLLESPFAFGPVISHKKAAT